MDMYFLICEVKLIYCILVIYGQWKGDCDGLCNMMHFLDIEQIYGPLHTYPV